GQQMPETAMAKGRVCDDANFADMTRPSVALAFEHSRPDNLSAGLRYHHGFAIEVDFVEPDFDLLAIEQVLLEEGAVVLGHAFKEGADLGAILRDEGANRDRRAIGQLQDLRISGEQIFRDRIVSHR